MNNLVVIERNKMYTTSNMVAEEFGIMHKEILRKIDSFTVEIPAVRFQEMFKEYTYVNDRNREYLSYKISRDGYMFLVMNISNKKANDKKLLFIDAFNEMEKILLNKTNTEWLATREQGKSIRLSETDTIKDFIEYAIKQGSENAKRYYNNYTRTTYNALNLIQNKVPKARDTLDMLELHQLLLAENLITQVIKREMEANEHYKVIYEKCKNALESLAVSLLIAKEKPKKIAKKQKELNK